MSPDRHLRFRGEEIPWVSSLRILGLVFDHGLTWRDHVSSLRGKATKKLNVLKAISHVARGPSTVTLLHLARATVVSALTFGSPIYSNACVSTRNRLEPVLNAALRIATGLPKWTPISVLRREAHSLSLTATHDLHRDCFLVRQLSLGTISPLLQPGSNASLLIDSYVGDVLSKIQVRSDDVLRWTLPSQFLPNQVQVIVEGLNFQSRRFSPALISNLFAEYVSTCHDWSLIATDASKDHNLTCIAYWDVNRRRGSSSVVSNINSIFTAETLAICFALDHAPSSGKLLIISDSKSALTSLSSVTHRSPTVVLHLHKTINRTLDTISEIRLVWVPGHMGISGNERADCLARTQGFPAPPIGWVSPEDVCRSLRHHYHDADSTAWLNCKYSSTFAHLTRRSWEHRKLHLPRRGEVLLSRLRTRTLPTRALLYKLHLCDSPVCQRCSVPETNDHFLLDCSRYRVERQDLYRDLQLMVPSPSFGDLCDLAVDGEVQARKLVSFILRTDRF